MGKPPRQDEPGAWHHLANRGARKQQTFYDASDCRLFLYLLAEARRRFGLEIHAFCLMGNHYHLLVHSPSGSLSSAMQMIGTNYSRRFNRRHGFDGPVFKAAFWSKRITTDDYLLEVSRYIHNNPKDLRPRVDAASYDWSSLRSYVEAGPKPWFLFTNIISGISGGPGAYSRFVDMDIDDSQSPYYADSEIQSGPQVWAPGRLIVPSSGPTEIALSDIDQQVAATTNLPIITVTEGGRGAQNVGRLLAIQAALELTGAPTEVLRNHYHFPTTHAMRATLQRSRDLMASEKFTALHAQVVCALE